MQKHRSYCAQIRSQGSRRRICPLPVPLPRGGGGAVWVNNCLFKFQSRQRDFLRHIPRQIAVLAALRCPKKSSRCSLARFFRPLRVLRLAASATGGARLRTPYPSPVAGEGPSGQITAYSGLRLGSVTFCASLLGKSQSLPPCGARKKSSRCSLARFFRPLRMLRLAASATGGARLRIPIHRDPLAPKFA